MVEARAREAVLSFITSVTLFSIAVAEESSIHAYLGKGIEFCSFHSSNLGGFQRAEYRII